MKSLSIAVPWNNASYIPCGGFHPLYQALFDGFEDGVVFNILDEPAFASQLVKRAYLEGITGSEEHFKAYLVERWRAYALARKFIDRISLDDLWVTAHIPGDVEFHHTCPLTTGVRPFVLFCESFLPIFTPFLHQGTGYIKKPDDVRKFYGSLLASANCLGIYSHLEGTIDQIKGFFKEQNISTKLKLIRIGLADTTYRMLATFRQNELVQEPCFLFTSSAHQQPGSFMLRGGHAVLLFMDRYLSEGKKGLFIFRCGRPKDTDFEKFGINIKHIHESEHNQQVIWIEGHLSQKEQLALFKQADFFLLPGIERDSLSVMQAQLAGAIPVVSNTFLYERLVCDGKTGIVINSIDDTTWEADHSKEPSYDNPHLCSRSAVNETAMQLYKRLTCLIDDGHVFSEMRRHMRTYARDQYKGRLFRDDIMTDIITRFVPKTIVRRIPNKNTYLLPMARISKELLNDLFWSPQCPTLTLRLESGKLYWLKGTYWFYPELAKAPVLPSWNPLSVAKLGLTGSAHVEIVWDMSDLSERLLPIGGTASTHILLRSIEVARRLYIRYPILKYPIKIWAPLLKRFLTWIEKSLINQEMEMQRYQVNIMVVLKKIPTIRLFARLTRNMVRLTLDAAPGARSFIDWSKKFYVVCSLSLRILLIVTVGMLRYPITIWIKYRNHNTKSASSEDQW